MQKIISIFKIPELTRKIMITLILLSVYRIGYYIPVPFIDQVGSLPSLVTLSRQSSLLQRMPRARRVCKRESSQDKHCCKFSAVLTSEVLRGRPC